MSEPKPPRAGLAEVVQWRAAAHGARHAFTFLANGEDVAGTLSYAELDRRARAIAAHLQERAPGQPVLLCYPSGLEFVAAYVACFYAGSLAIPAYPPRNRRHVARIRSIVADSGAPLVLSTGASVEEMRGWLPEAGSGAAQVCDTAAIAEADGAAWKPVPVDPKALAYLQYTSGSTSTPKGVMVSHENLLSNGAAIEEGYAMHPGSLTVSWLPLFHDMGLVLTLAAPLITGTPVVMMTPAAFVQRPLRWLEAVSRFRATHSGGPNFAFDLVVDRTTPEQRAALDLAAWETCYTGSEPIRKSTVERFNAAFEASGFAPRMQAPGYGLAEATLMVTRKERATEVRSRRLRAGGLQRHRIEPVAPGEAGIDVVGCGTAALETQIEIVDPHTRRRAEPGAVGEIWVKAPGVALGYWRNDEATEATFRARLDEGEGPFLRTGDLGFVEEGELYVTGRIKDVVILRGRNHYPHDIELTAQEAHEALERGNVAAFGVTVEGEERLVIVQEVARTALRRLDAEATLAAIRQAVIEEHEVEIHDLLLVAPLEVPKTSSGKVQRSEARERYLAEAFKVLARYHAPNVVPAGGPQLVGAIQLPAIQPMLDSRSPGIDAERQRAIERWLVARLAALRGLPAAEIGLEQPFAGFGIDSILAVRISGELEEWLQRPLAPTLLYEHPHIRALARHLASAGEISAKSMAATPAHEPIAIVGMGCRFPGARSPREFWEQLRRGADLVGEAPERGLGIRAGFIDEVDRFDADFFGIAPREAEDLDPQQRLLLEVAWSALEDAGIAPTRLAGTATGVFVGLSTRDYAELVAAGSPAPGAYFGTGTAASGAAGRLSYVLGLEGPSLVVDTACSSSLVAIHLAAQSLRNDECRVALAGGVNVILTPALNAAFAQARMLSARGRCGTFDASADGYVRGEGCGVLVLKRLADALADGDRVAAVLRGSAVNQDGRSNGLTAPNAQAQERVVRAALDAAGMAPDRVGYVEAHGTGTPLGDPIEAQALGRVFAAEGEAREPVYLGSVKTNIGHLEAAAGVAGVMKTVLALQHGEIPAHLHFERPSAMIPWEKLPLRVPVAVTPWPAGKGSRVAGVSSFGFVGTNAHVVLEAASPVPATAEAPLAHDDPSLLCVSAHSPQALDALVDRYVTALGALDPAKLGDFCASAARGRAHLRHRIAIAAGSAGELTASLEASRRPAEKRPGRAAVFHRGERAPGDEHRVVFFFTGQGSQYTGMGRRLYETEPAFRRALDRCAAAFAPHLRIPLLALMHDADRGAQLDRTEHTQPALFALEWSLAQMWRSWGLEPAALVGHSIGEYAAACVAGVFTLEEGAALVAARGRAMQALPAGGAMVAVSAGEAAAREAIEDEQGVVGIAAINGPTQCVLSGEAAALERVQARLDARGLPCERLNVSHAFHSPLMRPALDQIARAFEGVTLQAPRIPIFANVTGRAAAPGEMESPRYWLDQVGAAVRFADCAGAALAAGYRRFLEAGPHPTLIALAQQAPAAKEATWAATLRRGRDDARQVREAQAALYASGIDFDWEAVHRDHPHARMALPTYPFQRRRFWTRGAASQLPGQAATAVTAAQAHPVLGAKLPLAASRESVWMRRISLEETPWLADHQVDSSIVYPGAAFIESALLAAREALGLDAVELRSLTAERPLVLDPASPRELQTHLTHDEGRASIVFHGRADGEAWLRHGAATAMACGDAAIETAGLQELRARCPRAVAPPAFYEAWRKRGNQWGAAFQGIAELHVGEGEALARIEVPAAIAARLSGHRAHPAILDACGQALAAAAEDRGGAFVIKSVARARVRGPLEGSLWSHAVVRGRAASSARTLAGDVTLFDAQHQVIARFEDVRFEFLGSEGDAHSPPERWLHATEWIEAGALPAGGEPHDWVIVHAEEDARSAALLAGALAAHDHRARLASIGPSGSDLEALCEALLQVIHAARSAAQARSRTPPRLLVLTRGAWLLPGDAPRPIELRGALAWGLGRTLAAEQGEFTTVLADLDPFQPEAGIDALAARLHADAAEGELAVRGDTIRVPRLVPQALAEAAPPALRADGACLVTGGWGALGLQVARSLAERGCRHLVLMSRTPLPPRAHWSDIDPASAAGRRIAAISAIETLGASVHLIALDVSDEAALASWRESWRREVRPPIRSVVHAAGVVKRGAAFDLDRASLRRQLEGKVQGALALDRVFADDELDAFVLFSSASAVIGSPQLGAYAAANTALDAIARARRARGAAALSVQWGAWAGAGMASALGTETLDPAQALRILGAIWHAREPVLAVLPMAWAAWAARNPSLAAAPFFSRVTHAARPAAAAELLADLAQCPAEERRARLGAWLREQAAQVLRIAPGEIDARQPLTALGLDSLMALELRNRITAATRVALPLVELIRGAALAQLAEAIEARLGEAASASIEPVPQAELAAHPWPLSPGQESLWLLHSLRPQSASYHVAFAARVCSPPDGEALRRAWRKLRERHPMLRAQWRGAGTGLVQRVRTTFADSFETSTVAGDVAALDREALAAYRRPFDLEHGEPARLHLLTRTADEHVLLLVVHHIACDGWSLWILVDELRQLYVAECAGTSAGLPPLTHSYVDFIGWQRALVEGAEGRRQWDYWSRRLAGELPALDLPTDRPRPPVASGNGASHAFTWPAALRERIAALALESRSTAFTVLAAGLTALLHRYTQQDDILVGMPAAGRTEGAFAPVVGHFVNEVILRADLTGDPGFATLVERVREAVLGAMAAQDLPFPLLVQRLRPDRDPARSPLFQVNFVYQQAQQAGEALDLMAGSGDGAAAHWGELELRPHALHQQEGQFDITVELHDTGDRLGGLVKYDPDLFDAATIERFAAHYANLLEAALGDPRRRVSELAILSEAERGQALAQPESIAPAPAADDGLHTRFERVARARPDAIALTFEGHRMTYGELDLRANRLAARLRRLGVGPDALVALLFEPCSDTVVAILAVLKAGGAYLPLDTGAPDERLAFMLEDSRAPVLVTSGDRASRLAGFAGHVVDLDRDAEALAAEPATPAAAAVSSANVAYCIYTSGTTGRPKGVLVEHRQVTRLFDATQAWYAFDERDAWTLFHSYAFDFSVWEIWGALLYGGRLVVVPRAVTRAPDAFHALLRDEGVTVLNQTPSAFRSLIAADERAAAGGLALRLVVFGGEALDAAMLAPWIARHGAMPRLVNMYGITETTVHVTYAPVDTPVAGGASDIGVPIPDLQAYVLDRHMQPVPAGVRGELYVGGEGLARGYLRRAALTAQRFVPDPFGKRSGARLYRTGDLARRRADGTLEYLGRIDRQVKIRGFRIERGEIEAALRACQGVRDALVLVRSGAGGEPALFGYVTRMEGATLEPEALKRAARSALPEYMVPAAIHVLDAYPLTVNGKVDEAALAALGEGPARARNRVMPSTPAERSVAAVWSEVLGVADVGAHDNFFELGGHSLLVPRVYRRLQESFEAPLAIVDLFRHATVADLAAHLEGLQRQGGLLGESEERARLRRARRGARTRVDP